MAYAATVGLWIARYLGPLGFGRFSFAQATVGLFLPIATVGLNHVLTRAFVEFPERMRSTARFAIRARFVAATLASLSAVGVSIFLRPDDLEIALYVAILSVSLLARSLGVYEFVQFSRTRGDLVAKLRVAFRGALSIAHVAGILTGQEVSYFIVCLAAEVTLQYLVGWTVTRRSLGEGTATLAPIESRALLARGLLLVLSGVAATINLRIDQVMIGSMLGDTELGLYSAAVRISEILYVVPEAVVISLFPAVLAAKRQSQTAYAEANQSMLDLMLWSSIILSTVASLLAGQAVPFLLGTEYRAAVPVLLVHVWGSVFVFTRAVFSKWLIAEDLLSFSLLTQMAGGLTNVVINLALIPRFGGIGAAVATLVSYSFSGFFVLLAFRATRPFAIQILRSVSGPARVRQLGRILKSTSAPAGAASESARDNQ